MSLFSRASYHLSYFLNAVNQHSLQAPFIYDLYTKVIKSSKLDGDYSEIEQIRKDLLQRKEKINTSIQFGAKSKKENATQRTVGSIAAGGLTTPKYSALLYRLIKYFNMRQIIELGTSLGVNTMYLAKYEATSVTTFEGNDDIAAVAMKNFDKTGMRNIKVIKGNIDHTLSVFMDGSIKPDLVYIDANHTFEATLRYFNKVVHDKHDDTIVVIDDIKWSIEMHNAWLKIIQREEVTLSIDLNKCGLLFFNPGFTKQHHVLAF